MKNQKAKGESLRSALTGVMLMLIMSNSLSELLGANEPWFSLNLTELERASGNSGTDVRLAAEITTKIHTHIRSLDLDPNHTSGPELYYGLTSLVGLHDQFLLNHISTDKPKSANDLMASVKNMVERLNIPKQTWAIKHSTAKRLLKNHPPKNTMRLLKYRSLESMLKRESVSELYGLIRFTESPQWLRKFMAGYKKLSPTDFETRPIELIQLDGPKWDKITINYVESSRHNLIHSKEMGSILILPLPITKLDGLTTMLLTLLLHYINEIRLYAAYLKLKQIEPNFGELIVGAIGRDDTGETKMAGQTVHWRVIQRHLALQTTDHPQIFEPYLEADDLAWRKAEEVLYRLEPALMFWHDMDYVGVLTDDRPISFNLMDNAINYLNHVSYGEQSIHYMRNSLWNELQMRYLSHQPIERQILKQLDSESRAIGMIAQEMFG